MCIIVAKNKKVELPTIETLKNCFDYNSDGAGFMYVDKGRVIIDKGYMDFNDFKRQYEKLCKKFNDFKNKSLVMHFRIGTSGTNTQENTHPYCISTNYKELHKTKVMTDLGVVHNGIIHSYTPLNNKHNTNDTQEFIMKYLAPLYEHYKDFYKNKYIMDGLDDIVGGKLCFLDKNDNLYYVGDFVEDNGIMYSNTTYKSVSYWNSYYSRTWDTDTHDYLTSCGYEFDEVETEMDEKEIDKSALISLEPQWYIGNGYGIEKVGDRDLFVDAYTYDLYELKENNTMFKIGENTYVYDEDYMEVI